MEELISKIEEGRKESIRLRKALETESAALKKVEEKFEQTKEDLEAAFAKAKDSSKQQKSYDEAKRKKEFQEMKVSGIESEIEHLDNELIELDAVLHRKRIAEADERIRELLASFQKNQDEMAKAMIEVAALSEVIEKNIAIRRERIRVDPVRCLILDPKMKRIKANKRPAVVQSSAGPGVLYQRETFVEEDGDGIYDHVQYEIAARLQREGKVKIVEEGRPKYDVRIVEDARPPIVEDLKSLDLGKPVTLDGRTTVFFDEVKKVLGFDADVTPDSMYQMLFEKKYAGMRRIG
jgi:hypothetical protein